MDITETLHVTTREAWRAWLERHHREKDEIWLVSWRKAAGKPVIPYEEAVKEALCFGWIDSIRKSLDGDRLAQRFTPRRPGSGYSQTNRERLARLVAAGRVIPSVLRELEERGDWRPEAYRLPEDILDGIRADPAAWEHFQRFPAPYQRIRVAYVDHARGRGDEFDRRLERLVRLTARGKQFGYGIEEFYE